MLVLAIMCTIYAIMYYLILEKFAEREIEVEGIRSVFISVGGTWDEMVIEIMEPLDKSDMDNALSRRLARSGEGFYHLCIEVDARRGRLEEFVPGPDILPGKVRALEN